jgi:hypothetical protein
LIHISPLWTPETGTEPGLPEIGDATKTGRQIVAAHEQPGGNVRVAADRIAIGHSALLEKIRKRCFKDLQA